MFVYTEIIQLSLIMIKFSRCVGNCRVVLYNRDCLYFFLKVFIFIQIYTPYVSFCCIWMWQLLFYHMISFMDFSCNIDKNLLWTPCRYHVESFFNIYALFYKTSFWSTYSYICICTMYIHVYVNTMISIFTFL